MAYSLTKLAEHIYDVEFDFGPLFSDRYPDEASARIGEVPLIADWLEAHVGELNTLIYTDFRAANGEVEDPFGDEESAILIEMYCYQYYRKQGRLKLRSGDSTVASSSTFQSIREGDSEIVMPSGTASQSDHKIYRMLMIQSKENLEKLVAQ